MLRLSRIVAAAAVAVCVPAGLLMAQNAPSTGSDTTTAPAPAPAPAATTTPAPAATTPAPAAATSVPATAAPAAAAPATTQNDQPTKKKTGKMTRQQEIDKSIDSGTVPARYRKQVPKEYQQYIPFSK